MVSIYRFDGPQKCYYFNKTYLNAICFVSFDFRLIPRERKTGWWLIQQKWCQKLSVKALSSLGIKIQKIVLIWKTLLSFWTHWIIPDQIFIACNNHYFILVWTEFVYNLDLFILITNVKHVWLRNVYEINVRICKLGVAKFI